MSQHDSLRQRTEQHKPKNKKSKDDDKNIYVAAERVMSYLRERFDNNVFSGFELRFEHYIQLSDMINFIKVSSKKHGNGREDFYKYDTIRKIVPDGGVVYLIKNGDYIKYPLVIAEAKHQGTNKERMSEGKAKQATGNAIERLGKNLTAIRAYMHYENITPFVCFGYGCDFAENETTVLTKVHSLNEFYDINKVYVQKRDKYGEYGGYAPVSMFFREEPWSIDEMYDVMKEIAETSFRYWMC